MKLRIFPWLQLKFAEVELGLSKAMRLFIGLVLRSLKKL